MRPPQTITTLALAAIAAVASPIQAGVEARQAAKSVQLNIEGFSVVSYKGGFGGFETPLYTPPNARYMSFLGVGDRFADCDQYDPNLPLSLDCPGTPAVTGFTSKNCGPVNDTADGLYPLYNVTWSITLYNNKKFVVQYNIPDPSTGKTLVACDSFTKDQFSCDRNSGLYRYEDQATAGYGKNLTAKIGNVCPKS